MKTKSLKRLQNEVKTKKSQKLNDKQLSQVCGGNKNPTRIEVNPEILINTTSW